VEADLQQATCHARGTKFGPTTERLPASRAGGFTVDRQGKKGIFNGVYWKKKTLLIGPTTIGPFIKPVRTHETKVKAL
jgi:hypothetical protein